MSIQSEINRIKNNVQESLDVCRDAGVSVASDANSDALPAATAALSNEKASKAGDNNFTGKNVFYASASFATPDQQKFVVGDNSSAFVFGSDGLQTFAGTASSTPKNMFINYYGGDLLLGKQGGTQKIALYGDLQLSHTAGSDTPVKVQSGADSAYIGFQNKSGTVLGYYGVNASGQPVFYGSSDSRIYHAGYKPTASDVGAIPTSGGTVSGGLTVTGGANISGRAAGGGDDEGLVIGRASNNYAGLCLGAPTGVRSVFYLLPDNSAKWRYVGSSGTASDIAHPGKAGTIALTDDIPRNYLPNTGGTIDGSLDFSNPSAWVKTYLLAFKNADLNSSPTYPNTGFYQWGDMWEVSARDANNTWKKTVFSIDLPTSVANFGARPTVNGAGIALQSEIPTDYLPISGGTLTGNLSGKYIMGTWLQTTADNHAGNTVSEVCVQNNGWVYKRTNNEFRADLGGTADTNYTTLQTRGTSLHASDTNPSVNGAICWTYK